MGGFFPPLLLGWRRGVGEQCGSIADNSSIPQMEVRNYHLKMNSRNQHFKVKVHNQTDSSNSLNPNLVTSLRLQKHALHTDLVIEPMHGSAQRATGSGHNVRTWAGGARVGCALVGRDTEAACACCNCCCNCFCCCAFCTSSARFATTSAGANCFNTWFWLSSCATWTNHIRRTSPTT